MGEESEPRQEGKGDRGSGTLPGGQEQGEGRRGGSRSGRPDSGKGSRTNVTGTGSKSGNAGNPGKK